MGLFTACFAPKTRQEKSAGSKYVQHKEGKEGKQQQQEPKAKEVPFTKDASSNKDQEPEKGGPHGVHNPDSSLIQHMLDPEGPAAVERGKAYRVHYLGPPRPYCDEERVQTVKNLGKIDETHTKPQDPEIAGILRLVGNIFNAPAVLCALFDDKQVFVSEKYGDAVPCGHFPWRWTLCGWSLAFKSPQVLVIEDTHKDARFANNAKVLDGPKVRFYCGAPLLASNGHRLGTLCFADVKPRVFDRSSCIMMNSMSELVTRQLEKDLLLKVQAEENKALTSATQNLQRTIDCLDSCVVLLDTSKPGLEISFTNAAYSKITGMPRDTAAGTTLSELMARMDGSQLPSPEDLQRIKNLQDWQVHDARLKKSSEPKSFTLSFRPASRQIMDEGTIPFGVPSYLPLDGGQDNTQRFYFMTITPPGKRARPSGTSVGSSVLSTLSSTVNSSQSNVCSGVGEGLKLAHLLGRGSFACVYFGQWFGTDVAVKVIDHDLFSLLGSDGAVKEASMAFKLRHPHVVATLKYTVKAVGSSTNVTCSSFPSVQPKSGHIASGFSPRYLDSGKPNNASPPADSRWAVIQADAAIPEETETQVADQEQVSEDSLAMRELCKVKEEGWKELDSGSTLDSSRGDTGTKTSCTSNVDTLKQTWIIQEYCNRGSLQDALDRGWFRQDVGALDSAPKMDFVVNTALEIVSALQFMHSQDVVHGDMSAWNVMLTSLNKSSDDARGFVAKLCDFGFARALEAVAISTKTYGTITHMPPETLTQGIVSKAMDVYSFGVLMWQLYTGSRPFAGLRQAVIIDNVVHKKVRLQWPEGTPAAYREMADACMAYEPEKRPTFADLVPRLEAMRDDKELLHQVPAQLYF